MAVEVERLVAVLEARMDKYEKALKKAGGDTDRTFTKIERRGKEMEAKLAALGKNVFAGFAAGVGAAGFERLIDASARIQNGLKAAGLEGERLKTVYDALFSSAQRNAAPIEALAGLYGRVSMVQKELGVSSEQLLDFTDKVALALRVSGQSAGESSGALLQLTQALGSGTVRAEEFNSILEGALPIAQAVAAGLDRAGGSVAALRKLVNEGKVSSAEFFAAFERGSAILQEKVATAQDTVSGGMVRLQNTLIDTAGRIDHATGLSSGLAVVLGDLAGKVQAVGTAFEEASGGWVGEFFRQIGAGLAQLEQWKADFRAGIGLSGPGGLDDFLNGTNLLKGEIGFASNSPASRLGADIPLPGKQGPTFGVNTTQPTTKPAFSGLDLSLAQDPVVAALPAISKGLDRVRVSAAQAGGAIAGAATSTAQLGEELKTAEEMTQSFAATFLADMRQGKSAADAFVDAIGNVAEQLANLAISNTISGLFGGIKLGGASGAAKSAAAAGAGLFGRASGGPVSRGQAYLVGERGPEVLVPGSAGVVIPNGRSLRGGEVIDIRLQDDSGRMADIADRRIQTASGTIVNVSVQQSTQAVEKRMASGRYRAVGVDPGLKRR